MSLKLSSGRWRTVSLSHPTVLCPSPFPNSRSPSFVSHLSLLYPWQFMRIRYLEWAIILRTSVPVIRSCICSVNNSNIKLVLQRVLYFEVNQITKFFNKRQKLLYFYTLNLLFKYLALLVFTPLRVCIVVTSIHARSGLRNARFATLSSPASGHVVSATGVVKGSLRAMVG